MCWMNKSEKGFNKKKVERLVTSKSSEIKVFLKGLFSHDI